MLYRIPDCWGTFRDRLEGDSDRCLYCISKGSCIVETRKRRKDEFNEKFKSN